MADAEAKHDFGRASFDATIRFAEMAVRSLLILNGGAALGLLTFAGNAASRATDAPNFRWAIVAFGVGAATSVLTSGSSYFSQWFYSWANATDKGVRAGYFFNALAVVFAVAGLVAFGAGIYFAAAAM
jgi:hypothetical protein